MMGDRDFRLGVLGFLAVIIVWMLLESLEVRWHLRGLYDEIDRLRLVQHQCRFHTAQLVEASAAEVSGAERGAGLARSYSEADTDDVPWRAPDGSGTASSTGAL